MHGTESAHREALRGLAREGLCGLLPPWRRHAGLPSAEKEAFDLSGQDLWDERMRAAALANNPAAFRVALEGWERAGLLAISPMAFAADNEAGASQLLTQGVSGESRGCYAR